MRSSSSRSSSSATSSCTSVVESRISILPAVSATDEGSAAEPVAAESAMAGAWAGESWRLGWWLGAVELSCSSPLSLRAVERRKRRIRSE